MAEDIAPFARRVMAGEDVAPVAIPADLAGLKRLRARLERRQRMLDALSDAAAGRLRSRGEPASDLAPRLDRRA